MVDLANIKVLSEAKYNALASKPQDTLHFVELPMDTYIVESFRDGYNGYDLYSNGEIVQFGRLSRGVAGILSVAFLKTMANDTYNCQLTMKGADSYNTSANFYPPYVTLPTTTGMNITCPAAIANIAYIDWAIRGKVAEE